MNPDTAQAREKISTPTSAISTSRDTGETLAALSDRLAESRKAFIERAEERRLQRKNAGSPEAVRSTSSGSQVRPKPSAGAKAKARKGPFSKLISKYSKEHGIPYNLARSVVQVESSFRPNVTGAAGEIGLMQIKLSTARGMGYKGTRKQLYEPATNLYWGMKYLGKAHELSGGTTCGTILKYNAGHAAKRMNPVSSNYCKKVKRNLGKA